MSSNLKPPWRPGQSGNPGGRRAQVQSWFEAYAEVAFAAIVDTARQRENLAARNTAATYMVDRVLGRPTQALEATVSTDFGLQHLLAVSALNGTPILEGNVEEGAPYVPPAVAPPGTLPHERLPLFEDATPAEPGAEMPAPAGGPPK